MNDLAAKRDRLLAVIAGYPSCVVAFSGGVDSAVVAKAARLALGERAIAVTGVSPSLAQGELEEARRVAREIGIRHEVIETGEVSQAGYVRNAPDRCYHCKTELYSQLERRLREWGAQLILNGANASDLGDYRPGMQAGQEHAVRSPLIECGLTKDDVRGLAREWSLSVSDKPATPCLSSRIAYGEEVTPERLRMIDGAERYLRGLGLAEVRVRYHRGDLARVEVPLSSLSAFSGGQQREDLVARFKQLGFKYVVLDLEGFRSGSQNQALPLLSLSPPLQAAR